jgi:hypothetical protein
MQQQARLSHMIMGLRQSHDQQGSCLPFTRPHQPQRDFAATLGPSHSGVARIVDDEHTFQFSRRDKA